MEKCPFNNSAEVYCVDDDDLTHCDVPNSVNCSDHICVDWDCVYGDFASTTKECDLGGAGCRGCVCMKGWYSNHSHDCESHCGDGNLTSDKECDGGGDGCDNETCHCLEWWKGVGAVSCDGVCGDGHVVGKEECDGGDGCGEGNCRCGSG